MSTVQGNRRFKTVVGAWYSNETVIACAIVARRYSLVCAVDIALSGAAVQSTAILQGGRVCHSVFATLV